VTLKAIWAAVTAAAIAVGFALPAFSPRVEPKSQIEQLEIRR
jgi:hypothetical protein